MSILYVVATPIGNLSDISPRALDTLRLVDVIAAEDTRLSKRLLDHYGIKTRLVAYHDHNEVDSAEKLVADLIAGKKIALITDAGTPLLSDPGYSLVRAAVAAGITVSPVPGPSAMMAALSVAALPIDRFAFEGFLPAKQTQRKNRLADLKTDPRTLVFFEAPHRITEMLDDLKTVFGARSITIARELTKQFEQVWHGTFEGAIAAVEAGDIPSKGEFVVIVEGASGQAANIDEVHLMQILLAELPPATAASLGAQILGVNRKHLYNLALSLKKTD